MTTTPTMPTMPTSTLSELFAADNAAHVLTVAMDAGVHRHLRCAIPGTGEYSFQITTFPGHLAFTGDMGDYLFAWPNEVDVLPFFNHRVANEYYWTKKIVAPTRTQILVYSPAKLQALVDEDVSVDSFQVEDVTEESAAAAYADFTAELHELLASDGYDWHTAAWAVGDLLEEHGQERLEDVDFEDVHVPNENYLRALEAIRWAAATYYATRSAEQGEAS